MSDYSQKLQEMKKMLVSEDDFSRVYHFFFDHLACYQEFINLGKKEKNPILKATLKEIGAQVLGLECNVTKLELIKIRKDNFIHGGCFLNNSIATIVYFDDIDMGMAAINVVPLTSQMSYVRMSCTIVEDSTKAFPVSPGRRTIH